MSRTQKLQFEIINTKFGEFLQKLEDLSKIGDSIKIKIDPEEILIYSIVGEVTILAFKSYILKTSDYLKFKGGIESPIDIIISGSKKFVRSLGFAKTEHPIQVSISYKIEDTGVAVVRFFEVKNSKLKLSQSCGEDSEIRDIPKESLTQKLNPKMRKWGFSITREDFESIKKLSGINSEGKTINLLVDGDGLVKLSETSVWELEVDNIETKSKSIIFSKSHLSSINDSEVIQLHVFDSFILNQDKSCNLMISFETQFED